MVTLKPLTNVVFDMLKEDMSKISLNMEAIKECQELLKKKIAEIEIEKGLW